VTERGLTDLELLHGVDVPLASPRLLVAAPWEVELEGITVRHVRHRGGEVVRGCYLAVRDTGWGTLPLHAGPMREDVAADRFALVADVEADDGEIGIDATLRVEATGTGSFTVDLEGVARRAFEYCRFGLNVLLPSTLAGAPYLSDTGAAGRFPVAIAPQSYDDERRIYLPVIPPFRRLEFEHEGRRVMLSLDGDEFEVEDQRNWTDASFKVYAPPLLAGCAHQASRGQHFFHRLEVAVI
jgi:hypothetical protein